MAISDPKLFFARALRTVRAARHRTLRDLSAETGLRTATLSTAESGHLLLTEQQIETLAAALKVEPVVLTIDPEELLRPARCLVQENSAESLALQNRRRSAEHAV